MTTLSTWAHLTWDLSLRLETLFMTCLHLMGDSDYISGATLPQILNPLQINGMKMAAHWQLHALLTASPSSILMKSIQFIIKPRAVRGAFTCWALSTRQWRPTKYILCLLCLNHKLCSLMCGSCTAVVCNSWNLLHTPTKWHFPMTFWEQFHEWHLL